MAKAKKRGGKSSKERRIAGSLVFRPSHKEGEGAKKSAVQWRPRLVQKIQMKPSTGAVQAMRRKEEATRNWISNLSAGQVHHVSSADSHPATRGGSLDGGIWCSFRGQEKSLKDIILKKWPGIRWRQS